MTILDRNGSTITRPGAARASATRGQLRLLACGAAAGPVFAVAAIVQAATRAGFDITRHPISLLSDGPLGWIQIANFVVYGALTVLGARGVARAMLGTPGGRWAPRLIGAGGGLILVGGCFRLDPGNGFPAGAPAGQPSALSWHAYVHLAGGGIGFIALIAACFVLGHHFARTARPRLARLALTSGALFTAGDVWSMAGGADGSLTLCIGVLTGMLFISFTAFTLRRPQPHAATPTTTARAA